MLLLATLEANEVMSQKYLLVLSAVITAMRIGHTLQLAMPQKLPIVIRQVGFLSTVLFFIVCGAACVVIGLQVSHIVFVLVRTLWTKPGYSIAVSTEFLQLTVRIMQFAGTIEKRS